MRMSYWHHVVVLADPEGYVRLAMCTVIPTVMQVYACTGKDVYLSTHAIIIHSNGSSTRIYIYTHGHSNG